MQRKERVAIIGAGIQGVCTALFMQKKGFNTTLFDRDEPGNAASYGNAGHFSPYASLQLNRTDILSDVPSMLLSSRGPLALKWNYLPKMIPWFTKFVLNSSKRISSARGLATYVLHHWEATQFRCVVLPCQ